MDNTHLSKHAFTKYNQLRLKYNYNVYVVDCMDSVQGDNFAEIRDGLVKRDVQREYPVGAEKISSFLSRYMRYDSGEMRFPDWIKEVIPSLEFGRFVKERYSKQNWVNLDKYDRIKIVGDIHGDFDNLDKVFADHKRGTAYIFVGDYLDRGQADKIKATLDFLTGLKGKNIFFLRGNHERFWFNFANEGIARGQFEFTIKKLIQQGYTLEELRELINAFNKKLLPYLGFEFRGKKYFVSHAGLDARIGGQMIEQPMLFSERAYVSGIGDDPYSVNIDRTWVEDELSEDSRTIFNVHGHRNNFDVPVITEKDNRMSINLTQDGKFRWIELDAHGLTDYSVNSGMETWVDELCQDEDVKEIELEDGIVSHNFTREVFADNRWTPNTTKARGLFTRGSKIVGRGFDKFFNVGQNESATLDNLTYPVSVHMKYNGFLAIVFWDDELQKVQIKSKSGGQRFSILAKEVIEQSESWNKICDYYCYGTSNKTENQKATEQHRTKTLLFEIIDPVSDPHIVKYPERDAKFLAFVENTKAGTVEPNSENQIMVAKNREELDIFLEELKTKTFEGVVLYGANGFMLKYKTPFYLKAKELRNAMRNDKKKKKWYYGAESWYDYCLENGISDFSPDLALKLWKLENIK